MGILKNIVSKVKTAVVKEVKTEAYATTGVKIGGYTPPTNTTYTAAAIPSVGSAATTAAFKGNVVKDVVNLIKGTSTKTKVIAGLTAPSSAVIAYEVAKEPVTVAKTGSKIYFSQADFTSDIIKTAKGEMSAGEFVSEHPYGTAVVAAGAAYVGGKAATGAYTAYKLSGLDYEDTSGYIKTHELKTDDTKPPTSTMPPETDKPKVLPTAADDIPVTPETQIIGKSKTTDLTRRKGRVKQPITPINRINLNIINQSHLIQNRKFIY